MDCIDYVFGFTPKVNRPSKIVDNSNGYTHVELELKTDKGSVSLKREIGTTKVSVISHNLEIENGTYSSDRNAKKNINDIFLNPYNSFESSESLYMKYNSVNCRILSLHI